MTAKIWKICVTVLCLIFGIPGEIITPLNAFEHTFQVTSRVKRFQLWQKVRGKSGAEQIEKVREETFYKGTS